jgi:hypothetical protein
VYLIELRIIGYVWVINELKLKYLNVQPSHNATETAAPLHSATRPLISYAQRRSQAKTHGLCLRARKDSGKQSRKLGQVTNLKIVIKPFVRVITF